MKTAPLITAVACTFSFAVAHAATLNATYEFTNVLGADQSGVPALMAVNPLGLNGFLMDTVFGQQDTVYRFDGNASPATEQAGFSLNTTGLLTPNNYSVEMVFSFDGTTGYRRVIDVQDRQSDNGFYVDPSSHLNVFPASGGGPNSFTPGYHHVILTVASSGAVKGYIDGLTDFSTTTTVMNLSNSASNTMNFFLDNVAVGGQGEFSDGKIAQLRLYDGVLTDSEALTLSQNPIVPEPASGALLGLGAALLLRRSRQA